MVAACLEPPEIPLITGASSPSRGPGGQGRPVCEWALCPLACQAEMAYCLAASVWYTSVCGSQCFGGEELAALTLGSSRQCFWPEGEGLDTIQVCLKNEKVCVNVPLRLSGERFSPRGV